MDIKPSMVSIQTFEDPPPVRIPANVPAFLMKLWKIVDAEELDPIISWSKGGNTFKVHDQIGFSRDVLPLHYKHNNFSSFVRQVNMYGFRKIVDPNSGSLKPDRDEWEFIHSNFQEGHPELLPLIKRKATNKDQETKSSNNQITSLFSEVERLKNQHANVAAKLENVKKENELLWREVGDLRDQHKGQQNIINKLIQVFVKIMMVNKKDIPRGVKRRALDYPTIETKLQRPATQELLPYSNTSQMYSNLLPEETLYSVDSPSSPIKLTEVADDTITVVDNSRLSPHPITSHDHNVDVTSDDILNQSYEGDNLLTTSTTNLLTSKQPFVVKNDEKTITILPTTTKLPATSKQTTQSRTRKSTPKRHQRQQQPQQQQQQQQQQPQQQHQQPLQNTSTVMSLLKQQEKPSAGFAFPETYIEKAPIVGVDASQLHFGGAIDDVTSLTSNYDDTNKTISLLARGEPTNILLTPGTTVAPLLVKPPTSMLPQLTETMTTPVVAIPPQINNAPEYGRQDSFRDRKEISDNVEKINQSIEALQDMLEKQPNLDLKSLNFMVDLLPEQMSVNDFSRLLDIPNLPSSGQESGIDLNENDGQLIPYAPPLSPSQYLDPQFASSSSTKMFLQDENADDDILVE